MDHTFKVYYRKEPTFRVDQMLTRDQVINSRKYFVQVGTMTVRAGEGGPFASFPPLDVAYSKFQSDFMDPDRLAWFRANHDKVSHTSMSVGDCLLDTFSGKVWQCAGAGWKLVPARLRKDLTGPQKSLLRNLAEAGGRGVQRRSSPLFGREWPFRFWSPATNDYDGQVANERVLHALYEMGFLTFNRLGGRPGAEERYTINQAGMNAAGGR